MGGDIVATRAGPGAGGRLSVAVRRLRTVGRRHAFWN